ncbi:MAG: hypothetical protein PVG08_16085 [Desulfobacterales bacterium]|jgi:hypothetical protein
MKLSQLSAEFKKLEWRVDQLVQGVASSEFDERVGELGAHLKQLETWTKPRAGGKFEVDIEPYKSVGGAPAFMQEHAGLLLGAATILQNARKVQFAIRKRLAAADRDDLAVPLAALVKYTGEDLKKVQRLFKYLYSRRAYQKLNSGKVFVQSMEEGYLPDNIQTILQLSKHNLSNLRRNLTPLSEKEKELYSAFRSLPFYLKHATTAASWTNIYSSRLIFSLDSLKDWNIVVPTNTPRSDERYKQDVDFAFFRVEIGENEWVTRYGEGNEQLRVVFDWKRLLEDGWVSLHDMLAPLGPPKSNSEGPISEVRTSSGELVRVSSPDMVLQGGKEKWIHWKWKHTFPGSGNERKVHILDEVFYGPDILEGMTLSVLRDLRELPALQREALRHVREQQYWFWLFKSLFRVEAKYPSAFRFEPQEVVRTFRDDNSALHAATDHVASVRA